MRNVDENLKNIAKLTHSTIKKLCVDCGETPDFVDEGEAKKIICSIESKAMLGKFAKISNTKIIVDKKKKSVYEYFAAHLFSRLNIRYKMLKSLELRKIKAKQAINAKQRNLIESHLQKAKIEAILAMIAGKDVDKNADFKPRKKSKIKGN